VLGEPQQRLPGAALSYWRLQALGAVLVGALVAGLAAGGLWAVPVLVAGLVVAFFGPSILWGRWRYEIREEEIDLRHGLFTVKRTLVPIRRVQHVDTETGPLQGAFGLASVSFHTAAGATSIPALTAGEAETVRRRVADLARVRDDT
jgi:membrane protein YdbS with pleckstrin-like domain